jgi:hypothetical protein
VSFALGNPIKYNDPSGHCVMCLVVGGAILLGGYETAVGLGWIPDYVGLARAESAMEQNGGSIEVAAGLAVQSEFAGIADEMAGIISPGSSNIGIAQTNAEEIATLGLGSGNPNDPSVAVRVMQVRIGNAQAACHNCTARDRVIVAALAQNKGVSPIDLDGWSRSANGGGIAWEDIFRNSTSTGQFDAESREKFTGVQYENYFMVQKYVKDLRELYKRGWDLPDDITETDLNSLEAWARSNGQ